MANVLCNFRVTFKNNDTENIQPEVVIMAVTDGIMTVMDGNVQLSTTLFYEASNSAVLSSTPTEIAPELMYVKRVGGNLSSLIARKLSSASKSKTGGGVVTGAGVRSAGSAPSLFY